MTEKDLKGPLSPKQALALAALVAGKTVKQAAAAAHVQPKAVWTWRQQPAFNAELKRLRAAAFEDALEDLRRVTGRAVREADGLLKSKDERARLGAVRVVLTVALRANETVLLEERIAALERRMRADTEEE
jgi:hypothetical protein